MSARALALFDENELVDQIIYHNNDRAINQFVRTYQSFIIHTALRFLKNYDDADDVAQEVFIKALNSLPKFKRQSSLKTWLYKITVNMCQNELRKKKFVSIFSFGKNNDSNEDDYFDVSSNDPKPDSVLEFKESEALFVKAYKKLPEKQRETFILRYFEEMPYEEISKLLGTSVGGLKANYFQAIKKITEELKPHYGGYTNG